MLKLVSRYLKLLRINLLYSSGQITVLTVRKWITHKEINNKYFGAVTFTGQDFSHN